MQVNPRQSCTLDSLLGIPDSKRWRDSGFLEWNHGSQSPGFRTLQAKKKIQITSIGAKRARDFAEQAYFPGGQTLGSCFLKVFHFENKKSYLGRVKIVPR